MDKTRFIEQQNRGLYARINRICLCRFGADCLELYDGGVVHPVFVYRRISIQVVLVYPVKRLILNFRIFIRGYSFIVATKCFYSLYFRKYQVHKGDT